MLLDTDILLSQDFDELNHYHWKLVVLYSAYGAGNNATIFTARLRHMIVRFVLVSLDIMNGF